MTCRQNIAALQLGYYRLSREHRMLIINRAIELAGREPPLPGQEEQETSDPGRNTAPGDKPDGAE